MKRDRGNWRDRLSAPPRQSGANAERFTFIFSGLRDTPVDTAALGRDRRESKSPALPGIREQYMLLLELELPAVAKPRRR